MGFGLIMYLGFLGVFIGVVYLVIKLFSVLVLIVYDCKFCFFESWEVINGVFWLMVLIYLVVGILIMILFLVLFVGVVLFFLGGMLVVVELLLDFVDVNFDFSFEEVMMVLCEMVF